MTLAVLAALFAATAARDFRVVQKITPPEGAAVLLVPLPRETPEQRVSSVDVEPKGEVVKDQNGNAAMRIEKPPAEVSVRFDVHRTERASNASREDPKRWLQDDALVKVDDKIRKLSAEVIGDAKTPQEKARKVYEHVLSTMKYQKTGDGWGNGSLIWACDQRYGNCTDFHSLFIGLLRASGVPARFEIGRSIPPTAGEVAGYHCWAEYFDGKRWTPVDASEAWKHPEKKEFLFGHLDADRFALSLGRDLRFAALRSGPLNYFVDPVAENAAGERLKVAQKTAIEPITSAAASGKRGSP